MVRQQEALDLITQLEVRLKGATKDLADKIFYTNTIKRLRSHIQETDLAPLRVTNDTQPPADIAAPVNMDKASLSERSVFEETSIKLSRALVEWQNVRDAISDAIRDTDKRVTNVSVPARPNEVLYNTFNGANATALLIASTNSDAYVITRNDKGLVSAVSVKYWKSTTSVN